MEHKQIIEIISKDARDISKLTDSFTGYHNIPPLYLDLIISKVKNLYAELILLKEEDRQVSMEQVEQWITEKKPDNEETTPQNELQQQEPQKQTITDEPATTKDKRLSFYEKRNKKREEHFLATQLKYDPVKDIKKAISLNEKIWFIKELFHGDIETYNNTLARLNQLNYLEEALDFLDGTFSWDYDNQTVKDFMEFVYRRFI